MLERTCPLCEAAFVSTVATKVYCSQDCKVRARHRRKDVIRRQRIKRPAPEVRSFTCTCLACGTAFESHSARSSYCSPACRAEKRGRDRYVMVVVNGRAVAEHRAVMEAKLGRPLQAFENVHHLNGIRSDNQPENLELWTKPQPIGQRPEDLARWVIENYPEEVVRALRQDVSA